MRKIVPVLVMNRLLRSTTQRNKLQRWVQYIESYPNWLGTAERDLGGGEEHGQTREGEQAEQESAWSWCFHTTFMF